MHALSLSFSICLILANNASHRIEALSSSAIGVIYHPNDESLAQMLKDRVRYINKTLSHPSYSRNMQSIDIISIRQTSSKELLKNEDYAIVSSKVYSLARELEKFHVDAVPELQMNNKVQFQHAMEVLPKMGANYVLVICRPENLATVLEKAIDLGAIREKSRWFALDVNLKGNISKKCFKGLVGLQLNVTKAIRSRKNDKKKTSEIMYALLNDTLYAVVEALKQGVDKIKKYSPCFGTGKSGESSGRAMLYNLNNLKVKLKGRTGLVNFDNKTRSRMVERLDIVNVQVQEDEKENERSVLENVGHWDANKDKVNKVVQLNSLKAIDWTGEFWQELQCLVRNKRRHKGIKAFAGRKITVVTIEDSPFCQKKSNQTKLTERGHGYEGFSIDLLEEIKEKMGFEYELEISKEGKMNSLIDDLVNKRAHVAIGAITITASRELKVDFSKPFMDFRISLLMKKPTEEELNLFAFLLPFKMDVWLSAIAAVIGVTLLVYCLDYFSPSGYRASAAASGEGDGDELNLFNSLWFAAGSILQQGADNTPRCASGRMLAGAFWFFTLILISTYTANLAAYFTAKNAKSSINSLEDLANQNEIKYGVLNGGSLSTFFANSEYDTYRKMYSAMKRGNTFVNSTKDGVARVRQGGFAYLTDEPYLDYYNMKDPCDTMMLKNLLEAKSYGIGLQRYSDLTNQFSVAILELREDGVVDKLRTKWWDHKSDCPGPEKLAATTSMRISLDHMAGVFIVLAGGVVVSITLLLIERRCSNLREEVKRSGSLTNVRDQMDQPAMPTPLVFSRPPSLESKAINNMDSRRNTDVKGDGARNSDNLSVPRRQTGRLPNVYAGAPESNL